MKKMLALVATVLVMSATTALAAAPAAPVFNAPVKIADGKIRNPNNKVAVDGNNVYLAYEDFTLGSYSTPFHVGKSANSGATWGLSAIPDSSSAGIANITRVAVGIDPVYSGLKIVHTVWINEARDLMYSYFATRPGQTGWSTPVRINGSYLPQEELDIVVTSNGAIHVLVDNYYTTASSPDSAFTEPVALPAAGVGSIVKDSKNNLYVALSDRANIRLTKKAAGSSTWSTPVTVTAAGTDISGYIGLAVVDTNTYYIGYGDNTTAGVKLAVTTNGGTSWTRRAVPLTTNGDVAIATTSTKVVTLVASTGVGADGYANIIKVVRTNDNGATWSQPVTIQADGDPIVTLDANNKAMIIGRDGQQGQDWSGVRTNANANIVFIKEK